MAKERRLPAIVEAAIIKYTGLCPLCKRFLDDHDLLGEKPVCPK